jgi:hypothetical protein
VKIESVADQSIDPVSDVLKWILLTVAIVTFAVLTGCQQRTEFYVR